MDAGHAPVDERLLEAAVGTLEIFGIHLGRKLGLYAAISDAGSVTAAQLAKTAGINDRYAREWLEQQAVAGYLTVTGPSVDEKERAYGLSEEQAAVLVNEDDPAHLSPLASMAAGIASVLDQIVDAYRTGSGVPYSAYGEDFRAGQGGINRPAFMSDLITDWIPSAPMVHKKLTGGQTRVAEIGCGQGWAAIALAGAFPKAEVIGLDADSASIEDARTFAAERGVNVRFEAAAGESLADYGPFDVVLVLETLHDMARPVDVLRSIRKSLNHDGVVLVADERVAESFGAPGDLLERMMYGWSITHCLPASMADQPSAGLGTVLRSDTVRRLGAEAGFENVEVLDTDAGFFRLYTMTG
jgi:SAM-dependent methyltransferase